MEYLLYIALGSLVVLATMYIVGGAVKLLQPMLLERIRANGGIVSHADIDPDVETPPGYIRSYAFGGDPKGLLIKADDTN